MTTAWADAALRAHRQAETTTEIRRVLDEKAPLAAAVQAFGRHPPRAERMLRAVLTAQRQAATGGVGAQQARQTVDGALDWVRRRADDQRWTKEQSSCLRNAWQAAMRAAGDDANAGGDAADPLPAVRAYAAWLRDVRQQVRAEEGSR